MNALAIHKKMQYLDTKYFSSLQNWIVNKKVSGCSYENICLLYNEEFQADDNLNKDAIKTCLKRSSLSMKWLKGETFGKIPVLSDVDIDTLKAYILDSTTGNDYIDVDQIVEMSAELRNNRFSNAQKFLIECNCYSIMQEVQELYDDYDVCNTWVYQNIKTLETELCTPQNVEINRLIAWTQENIQIFIDVFSQLLLNTNLHLFLYLMKRCFSQI